MVNEYSRTWFELFLETRPFTQGESKFAMRQLPNPPFSNILDICCGQGRITNVLAQAGYAMVGIDRDKAALEIARQNDATRSAKYLEQDMRHLHQIDGMFDGVILLWQSFGYFDEATNESILKQIGQMIKPNGRFVLDIYNRAYWKKNQGRSRFERKGVQIEAENVMSGNRLTCHLNYGDGNGGESMDWQLFYHDEIIALAQKYSLIHRLSCVESDENNPVSDQKPQMQLVFEKL